MPRSHRCKWTPGAFLSTRLEAVLEPPCEGAEVPHPPGARGLSPLGLLAPVILADLGRRIAARGTGLGLVVECASAASCA